MQEDPEDFAERPEEPDQEEQPQVLALNRKGSSWVLSRRELITGAGAAGAIGCKPEPKVADDQPTETPAVNPETSCLNTFAHRKAVTGFAVSGDGKSLASIGEDSRVKLWSFPEGGLIQSFSLNDATTVGLNKDASRMTVGTEGGEVLVYSIATGGGQSNSGSSGRPTKIDAHDGPTAAAVIGPDGLNLLSGGTKDGRLKLRTLADQHLQRAVAAHDGGLAAIAASRDGKWIATAGNSGSVRLWSYPDVQAADEFVVADPKTSRIQAISFSRDGKLVAAADEQNASVWDTTTGRLLHTVSGGSLVAFSPNGELLATGRSGVHVHSLNDGRLRQTVANNASDPVNAAAFTPDGDQIVTAHQKGGIRVWNVENGTLAHCFMDLQANPQAEGSRFTGTDSLGRKITYTLPCGSRLPPGTVCVCNCVPGTPKPSTSSRPVYRPSGRTRTYYYPT